jgi:hypothetical protein
MRANVFIPAAATSWFFAPLNSSAPPVRSVRAGVRSAAGSLLSGAGFVRTHFENVRSGAETVRSSVASIQRFGTDVTDHTVDTSQPGAPVNLTLRQDNPGGPVIARYQPSRSPSMNEVQKCIGDPNVDANWSTAGMFSGGKAELGNHGDQRTGGHARPAPGSLPAFHSFPVSRCFILPQLPRVFAVHPGVGFRPAAPRLA